MVLLLTCSNPPLADWVGDGSTEVAEVWRKYLTAPFPQCAVVIASLTPHVTRAELELRDPRLAELGLGDPRRVGDG
jgi:hypothetical protein